MEHSPAGAAGTGPSVTLRFPGAQGEIWLNIPLPSPTAAMGPGILLEEIELKEKLSNSAKYPNKLELVWETLNYYCNIRGRQKGLKEADEYETIFRREVSRLVTKVNTDRSTKKKSKLQSSGIFKIASFIK